MPGFPAGSSVRDENGVLWLAKFGSRHDTFNVPVIESATLRLAQLCGLTVPPTRTLQFGGRHIMLIQRFDRYWATTGTDKLEKRLGFISGLTLLGCDESESPTKSYADLAQAIRQHCHPAVIRQDNREMFARMVYNIFVSNDDDHLRNHAFVWDPQLVGWRLSPLYDVMPRPGHAFERTLHLGVGQQGRAATLDNALSSKVMFSLSQEQALSVVAEVWQKVREWRVYFDEFGVSPREMDAVATAFRHIDDVSTAELRRLLP